ETPSTLTTTSEITRPTPTLRSVEESMRIPRLKQIDDEQSYDIPMATEPYRSKNTSIIPTYYHYQSKPVDWKKETKPRSPNFPEQSQMETTQIDQQYLTIYRSILIFFVSEDDEPTACPNPVEPDYIVPYLGYDCDVYLTAPPVQAYTDPYDFVMHSFDNDPSTPAATFYCDAGIGSLVRVENNECIYVDSDFLDLQTGFDAGACGAYLYQGISCMGITTPTCPEPVAPPFIDPLTDCTSYSPTTPPLAYQDPIGVIFCGCSTDAAANLECDPNLGGLIQIEGGQCFYTTDFYPYLAVGHEGYLDDQCGTYYYQNQNQRVIGVSCMGNVACTPAPPIPPYIVPALGLDCASFPNPLPVITYADPIDFITYTPIDNDPATTDATVVCSPDCGALIRVTGDVCIYINPSEADLRVGFQPTDTCGSYYYQDQVVTGVSCIGPRP
ncbi:hypothetical protein WR25_03820, partial [Diploscapter pachys]